MAKSRTKSSSCEVITRLRPVRASRRSASPSSSGGPDRATRSARPSAAAADPRPARGRWRPAALRRPTARAAARCARWPTPSGSSSCAALAPRPPHGERAATCTGASVTFSIAVRCSNRKWNWNTMPTCWCSSRSVAGRRARRARSRRRRSAAVERLEAGDGAQDRGLARAREPHQRDDLAALRGRSTPRRISRAPRRQLRPCTPSTARHASAAFQRRAAAPGGRAAATSPGRAARRERRDHPAADVGGEDLRLLGQLDDGDHRDQRRVLEQRDEVVGHRRQRERNACGPRISRSVCASLKPSVRAASSWPRGTASSAPR